MYNRRSFLDKLAASKGLNPLLPENWNKITYRDIQKTKVRLFTTNVLWSSIMMLQGGSGLLKFFKFSREQLLLTTYPDIGLEFKKYVRCRHRVSGVVLAVYGFVKINTFLVVGDMPPESDIEIPFGGAISPLGGRKPLWYVMLTLQIDDGMTCRP